MSVVTNYPTDTTANPRDNITRFLTDAKAVESDNLTYNGSLAALYDVTWAKKQQPEPAPELVFVSQKVERDEPKEATRANVDIQEHVTVLEWKVGGEVPAVLQAVFKTSGILVRNEYRFILRTIWDIFGKDGGAISGYVPKPQIEDADINPPYNPFVGLNVVVSHQSEVPGVIVSGTPGIGKSLFLLYVLALRLLARKTTVYQIKPNEFLVFHKTGVYTSEQTWKDLLFLPNDTWFLVDSNLDNIVPPTSFLDACNSSSRKVVMAASPRANRFRFVSKYPGFEVVYLNPFALEEYITARQLQFGITRPTERDLESFFRQFGPSTCAAFENASYPEKQLREVKKYITGLSWNTIEQTLNDLSRGYFESNFSRRVLIAKRQEGDPYEFYVEFASRFVADLVFKTFMEGEVERGIQLYRLFLERPRARSAAGNLLEACIVNILPLGGQWEMHAMKKSLKRSTKRDQKDQQDQHWTSEPLAKSSTLSIGHQGLAVEISPGKKPTEQDTNPEEFTSVELVDYDDTSATPVPKKRGFFVPNQVDNHESFDAWIYEPDTEKMVLLQSTVKVSTTSTTTTTTTTTTTSPSHDIKTKGLKWLGQEWLKTHTVDLVVVTDEEGGTTDITSPFETNANWIENVYRLVYRM